MTEPTSRERATNIVSKWPGRMRLDFYECVNDIAAEVEAAESLERMERERSGKPAS